MQSSPNARKVDEIGRTFLFRTSLALNSITSNPFDLAITVAAVD